MLIKYCIDKAKTAGLPLYAGSEPQTHKFFLGNGFKDTKKVDIDLSRFAPENSGYGIFSLWAMVVRP